MGRKNETKEWRRRESLLIPGAKSADYRATFQQRGVSAGSVLCSTEKEEARALFGRLQLGTRLKTGLAGLRVLECGCGGGWFSTWMASQGALVTAIDAREEALDETWSRALAEGVTDRLEVHLTSLLELDLGDQSFDLVVGRLVLHHGSVEPAALEIRRVLRVGGLAAFEENSSRNRLLMNARAGVRLTRGLGLRSRDPQYPLTEEEILQIDQVFDGHFERGFSELVLFRTLDRTILRGRSARCTRFLTATDRRFSAWFPFLRKAGFLQSLWMERR